MLTFFHLGLIASVDTIKPTCSVVTKKAITKIVISNGGDVLFEKEYTTILASEMQIVKVKSDGVMDNVRIDVREMEGDNG